MSKDLGEFSIGVETLTKQTIKELNNANAFSSFKFANDQAIASLTISVKHFDESIKKAAVDLIAIAKNMEASLQLAVSNISSAVNKVKSS